jgi:hypothetical protein
MNHDETADKFLVLVKLRIPPSELYYPDGNQIARLLLEEIILMGFKANGITGECSSSGMFNRALLDWRVDPADVAATVRSVHRSLESVGLYKYASVWFQTPEANWHNYHAAEGSEDGYLANFDSLLKELKADGELDRAESAQVHAMRLAAWSKSQEEQPPPEQT